MATDGDLALSILGKLMQERSDAFPMGDDVRGNPIDSWVFDRGWTEFTPEESALLHRIRDQRQSGGGGNATE